MHLKNLDLKLTFLTNFFNLLTKVNHPDLSSGSGFALDIK